MKSTISRVSILPYCNLFCTERRYEPRCYQFVVFECVRKLALTGLLIFIYPESASQIAIGLLIAVLAKEVYAQRRPYIEDMSVPISVWTKLVEVPSFSNQTTLSSK